MAPAPSPVGTEAGCLPADLLSATPGIKQWTLSAVQSPSTQSVEQTPANCSPAKACPLLPPRQDAWKPLQEQLTQAPGAGSSLSEALTSSARKRWEGRGGARPGLPLPQGRRCSEGVDLQLLHPLGPEAAITAWLEPPGLLLLLGMQTIESEARGWGDLPWGL